MDPEHSVFHDYFHHRDAAITSSRGSDIEGIGRPRVEPSFVPDVIDRMVQVPNAASYAAMRFLERLVGRRYGGSTGTDFYAAMQLACEMSKRNEAGSIVTLACDSGDRYTDTYYNDAWLASSGYDMAPYTAQLEKAYASGIWSETHRAPPAAAPKARPLLEALVP
ncbi:putative siderophore biosynthesis protein SbnA [compost metagenome]